jgi:hypothetical protein
LKTTFEVALKIANGEYVSKSEALEVLVSCPDADYGERGARIRARNMALQEAAFFLGADGASEWVVAERLEHAVLRFRCGMWRRIKYGAILPMTPSEKALKKAFLTGMKIPTTQRRIWDVIRT